MSISDGMGGIGPMGGDPFATLEALKDGRIQGKDARIRAASDLMESSFFQELFKAMRDTVPEGGLTDGGGGEDAFTAMMDEHMAEAAASRMEGGVGAALYRFLAGLETAQDSE
jgi:flagellar protein FlgJ